MGPKPVRQWAPSPFSKGLNKKDNHDPNSPTFRLAASSSRPVGRLNGCRSRGAFGFACPGDAEPEPSVHLDGPSAQVLADWLQGAWGVDVNADVDEERQGGKDGWMDQRMDCWIER